MAKATGHILALSVTGSWMVALVALLRLTIFTRHYQFLKNLEKMVNDDLLSCWLAPQVKKKEYDFAGCSSETTVENHE